MTVKPKDASIQVDERGAYEQSKADTGKKKRSRGPTNKNLNKDDDLTVRIGSSILDAVRELMGYVRRYYTMDFEPEAAGLWAEPMRKDDFDGPYKTVVSLIEANREMSLLKLKINKLIGEVV